VKAKQTVTGETLFLTPDEFPQDSKQKIVHCGGQKIIFLVLFVYYIVSDKNENIKKSSLLRATTQQ